jgi:hypothetical protein
MMLRYIIDIWNRGSLFVHGIKTRNSHIHYTLPGWCFHMHRDQSLRNFPTPGNTYFDTTLLVHKHWFPLRERPTYWHREPLAQCGLSYPCGHLSPQRVAKHAHLVSSPVVLPIFQQAAQLLPHVIPTAVVIDAAATIKLRAMGCVFI